MSERHPLRPFRPPWWLRGPHAQTLGGRYLRRSRTFPVTRERLETPDGDFVDLDFAPSAGADPATPRVVVLHHLRARYPEAALGAVGFSLGGNVLLKYLDEEGADAGRVLRAAVAVSVPFDLAAGAHKLERGMGRIYTRYFMRKLLRKSEAKHALLESRCDLPRVRGARTLRAFDDAATAPLHGFSGAEEYYRESSSARFLASIRVPTLLLHSLDDPFLPEQSVPRQAIRDNPALIDGVVPGGGHVGFVAGTPREPLFWAEREAARFLAGELEVRVDPDLPPMGLTLPRGGEPTGNDEANG
jgi:predicted alpha/beta-fold hydrolase